MRAEKIVIIGTSGSGKTTLGRQIAAAGGHRFVDLDDLYWLPGWRKESENRFLSGVKEATSCRRWVVTGNYPHCRELLWRQADLIIWLNVPLRVCLWRALRRSFRRMWNGESCCNNNRESVARLLSRNSILLWIWNTHGKRQREYTALMAEAPFAAKMIAVDYGLGALERGLSSNFPEEEAVGE